MFPDINYDGTSPVEKDITIVSEKHCWRTLGGVETDSYLKVREAVRNGCHLQSASFVLRHPEVMLCDLSNLERPLSLCATQMIEIVHAQLDAATRAQRQLGEFRRIHGNGLNPEIAISGSSKSELERFKSALLAEVFGATNISAAFANTPHSARGLERASLLVESSLQTQDLYNDFCAYYGRYITPAHWRHCSALNLKLIYSPHEIWSKLTALADHKLFILSAGLALGAAYVEATRDRPIYFTEVHRQNDPSALHRVEDFDEIYPDPRVAHGSWLVVDKAYTGGSLRLAAKRLRKCLGYDVPIRTVALFPKSLEAVAAADYVVYAGRLIDVRSVIGGLKPSNWHLQLLHSRHL